MNEGTELNGLANMVHQKISVNLTSKGDIPACIRYEANFKLIIQVVDRLDLH